MAYISKMVSNYNVYSLFDYKAYDDNSFFNRIKSLINDEGNVSDTFLRIIDDIVNLYKDELVFNLDKMRNYEYICPVISNKKFYYINRILAEEVSKRINVPVLIDFFKNDKIDNVDVRDAYVRDNNLEFEINEQFLNKSILFIDVFCSTGVVLDYIASKFKENSNITFVTIGVRFNASRIDNTRIISVEEMDYSLNHIYSDGYVVKINGLFNKKDVVVDLRKNLSIVIGVNGDGKTTAYKIATLATSEYVGDILHLHKYYFNSIEIYKYQENEMIDTKIIEYIDVLPSRKKIKKYFKKGKSKNEKTNKIRKTLVDRLAEIYSEEIVKFLTEENNVSKVLPYFSTVLDEEYVEVYRKIIYNNPTWSYDLNKILKKYELRIDVNLLSEFLKKLLLNKQIYVDPKCFSTSTHSYLDCTMSRRLTHSIYMHQMVFNEEEDIIDFENYFEDYDYDGIPYESFEFEGEQDYYKHMQQEEDYYKHIEFADDDTDDYIDEYSDDYWDEFNGYNGMDPEPDDRDIEEFYRQMEEFEESYDDYYDPSDFYDEDEPSNYSYSYSKSHIHKPNKKNYKLKDSLLCLYRKSLLNTFNKEISSFNFPETIYVDELFETINPTNINIDEFLIKLQYDKEESEEINDKVEKEFNKYLNSNKILIQYALNYVSKDSFAMFSQFLNNKKLKNRVNFIEAFKKFVSTVENSITKKLLIVEKIINKYFVDKKVIILSDTLCVVNNEGEYIPLESLSSGERNLILILLFIAGNKRSIIFDEPDLSMNITWQNELIKDILRLRHPNQKITILTQNPQLISYPILTTFLASLSNTNINNYNYSNEILGEANELAREVDLSDLGDYIKVAPKYIPF